MAVSTAVAVVQWVLMALLLPLLEICSMIHQQTPVLLCQHHPYQLYHLYFKTKISKKGVGINHCMHATKSIETSKEIAKPFYK